MKRITNLQGVGPSLSGATRVRIIFEDMSERHFYMKRDGGLFIPPNHTRNVFANPLESIKEWVWVCDNWIKTGSDAIKMPNLLYPLRGQAVVLCERLETDTYLYERALQKKLEADKSKVLLKSQFGKTFKEIKKKINNEPIVKKESHANPAPAPPAPVPSTAKVIEMKKEEKPSSTQINKFNKRYGR